MSTFVPRRPPSRTAGLRRSPLRSTRTSTIAPIPASAPPVATATGATSGSGSGRGGSSITRASGAARTGRLSGESAMGRAMLLLAPEGLFVDAVLLDDVSAHALHGAVHRLVVLEDPAHLAAALARLLGHVEVLAVQERRHAGVLVLGLDAEEADPHLVDPRQLQQQLERPERQQPPVRPRERLVEVRHRQRD